MLQSFKKLYDWIPSRFIVAVMAFFACWCVYMLRLNLSVTIIAMSRIPVGKENRTDEGDYGPRYDWGEKVQGDLLSAYSYGYFITQVPGGILAEYFGARLVVFSSLMTMGVFTILTPLVAQLHWGAVMAVRIIIGLGGGAVFPALHNMVSRWAPPEEKSRFLWALFGGTFGSVVSFPLCGIVVQELGWSESFYIFGAIVLCFCILWILLISDSPRNHPRISQEELHYIEEKIGTSVINLEEAKRRNQLPVLKVMTSVPLLALLLCHYGNGWGLFFILTLSPKFMSDILDFNLKDSGGMSSLPHLARVGFGFIFSAAGDYMVKQKTFSRTTVRKLFVIFSHLLAGLLMFLIGYMENNVWLTMFMMTMSLGMNGAATVTDLANHHDLAPNYAGSLYGIMNTVSATSGFIGPTIAGRVLEYNNGLYEWRILFIIGASFYIITGIIFILFGSGNIQSWNTPGVQEQDQGQQSKQSEQIPVVSMIATVPGS